MKQLYGRLTASREPNVTRFQRGDPPKRCGCFFAKIVKSFEPEQQGSKSFGDFCFVPVSLLQMLGWPMFQKN